MRVATTAKPRSRRWHACGLAILAFALPRHAVAGAVRFVDVAAEVGLGLRNVSGGAVEKWTILESTGAGGCFLDVEGDGDLDVYLVNGGTLDASGDADHVRDALYLNDGDGRFVEVTARSGLSEHAWGGGCAVADYDGDGDPDLYVTNFGQDALLRNQGDGSFRDVTAEAGLVEREARWGVGAVFFDADRDGDLDLYVANYLRFDLADPEARSRRCRWKGGEVMCGPRGFPGEPDVFYRNRGDGTFEDATQSAGLGDAGYGMGVIAGDLDADGDVDLFVANDSQENLLLVNDGSGRFVDQALVAGVALSGDGRAQAGMGADLGDVDGDGDEDLVVTHFSDDYHTLYRNEGDLLFSDVSAAAGLDPVTRPSLGWGGGFFDFDNDGDLDLFVASAHVYLGVERFDPATRYAQRNLLLENDGSGRFREVSAEAGPGFAVEGTGRGAAFGDWDDDGDLDVLVVNMDALPSLLRNDGGNAGRWIKLRLVGSASNRDGLGAKVRLIAGGRTQAREVRWNAGYASSHDPRLHFGLGAATTVDRLEVRWPSGRVQEVSDLPAGHLVTLDEARGVVSTVPLKPRGMALSTVGSAPPTTSAPAPAASPATSPPTRLGPHELRRVDEVVQLGTQRVLSGDYEQAIAAYERAIAALPSWEAAAASPDALGFGEPESYRSFLSSLHGNLGVALLRAERLQECAAPFERALALAPGRGKLLHNLGLCHYHAHRFAEAVTALTAAAETPEPRTELAYDLGRALAGAGRCAEAEEALDTALAELPRPDERGRAAEAWYHLGGCRLERGLPAEAAAAFREALALVPGHQKALYRLAVAWRRQQGRQEGRREAAAEAERLFAARREADEAARELERDGEPGRQGRLRRARAFLVAHLAPRAVQEARMAVAADPRDALAWLVLGEALLALRPPALAAAEEAFRRASADERTRVEALVGLGESARQAGRVVEAERWLIASLAARPGDVAASLALARVEVAAGRAGTAMTRLAALRELRPDDPAVALVLAEVLAGDGAARRSADALHLLAGFDDLYGAAVSLRYRSLVRLGRVQEAASLLEDTPFLGQAEREALAAATP